jgi:hypothetical protein
MAYFPSLAPNQRSYDLGRHPVITQPGWAGGAVRFRTGPTRTGATLSLTFLNLTEIQAALIRSHYDTQGSGAVPFQLGSVTLSDPRYWVYVEPPQESHRSGAMIDVTVKLESTL